MKNIEITSSFVFQSDSKLQVLGYQWTRLQILFPCTAQDALPEIQTVLSRSLGPPRTGNSSGNGEVSARSVLLRVIFALSFFAARLRIVCEIPISPTLTQRLYRKFEGGSIQVHRAILRGALIPGDI